MACHNMVCKSSYQEKYIYIIFVKQKDPLTNLAHHNSNGHVNISGWDVSQYVRQQQLTTPHIFVGWLCGGSKSSQSRKTKERQLALHINQPSIYGLQQVSRVRRSTHNIVSFTCFHFP